MNFALILINIVLPSKFLVIRASQLGTAGHGDISRRTQTSADVYTVWNMRVSYLDC